MKPILRRNSKYRYGVMNRPRFAICILHSHLRYLGPSLHATAICGIHAVLVIFSKGIPDPRGRAVSNSLDYRLYSQRVQQLASIRTEAAELRQTCTDASEAVAALEDYVERLRDMANEVEIVSTGKPLRPFGNFLASCHLAAVQHA